jgi:hypothetical protein
MTAGVETGASYGINWRDGDELLWKMGEGME